MLLLISWVTFAFVCVKQIQASRCDSVEYTRSGAFGSIRNTLLFINIFVQTLYGVLFMIAFHAPDSLSQETEQHLYSVLDGLVKVYCCVLLMTWRDLTEEIGGAARLRSAQGNLSRVQDLLSRRACLPEYSVRRYSKTQQL